MQTSEHYLSGRSAAITHRTRAALQGDRIIRNAAGVTLFEIMLAVAIVAIAIVPMLTAFTPGLSALKDEEKIAVLTHQARGTLNRVAALDFTTLNNSQGDPVNLVALFGSQNEADRETFSFDGQVYTPVLAIADASGGVGSGLLEITVTVDPVVFRTLKAAY